MMHCVRDYRFLFLSFVLFVHLSASSNYTIKTLDVGGYEIEFPSAIYLELLKRHISIQHPDVTWREYTNRHVTKLKLDKSKTVTIHLAHPSTNLTKVWIFDEPSCKEWFNGEFQEMYTKICQSLNEDQGTKLFLW